MEVLIALVILSTGLLGLAALQAEGLRSSSSAYFRYSAVGLLNDITDRMRANIAGQQAGHYAAGTLSSSHQCSEEGSTAANDCTAQQLAEYDLFQWNALVLDELPGSSWTIVTVPGNATQNTITVNWVERDKNLSESYTVEFSNL